MFTGLGGERLWLCPTLNDSANDISGNGNNGVYQNGMATVADTGAGGSRSYHADAVNQKVLVSGFGANLSDTTTISLWVKSINPWVCVPVAQAGLGYSASTWQYAVFNSTATRLLFRRNANLSFSNPTPSNQWQHICIVRETGFSTQEVYVDGVLDASSASNTGTYGTNQLWFGFGNSVGTNEELYLDDMRTYGRVLTQAEIARLASQRGVQGNPYYKPLTLKSRVTRLLSNRAATLLERIRSASKPTTPISIKVKHNEEPSYKAGYAKNAGESENPHLWKGLVGAWMPSLGVTGDTLRDVSGNGNDGTLTNMDAASDWVGTKYGSGLRFTGTTMSGDFRPTQNYVSIGYDFGIMQDISASFWIKPNSLVKRGICANDVPTSPKFAITLLAGGGLEVYRGGNTQSTQSLEVDKWQHVLVESVDGVTSYYFGARFDRSQSQSAGGSAGNAFVIGANYWGGVEADIANFTIYNRALFPDEIQTLYVDSLAPFRRKKSPIGYQPNKELKGLIRT